MTTEIDICVNIPSQFKHIFHAQLSSLAADALGFLATVVMVWLICFILSRKLGNTKQGQYFKLITSHQHAVSPKYIYRSNTNQSFHSSTLTATSNQPESFHQMYSLPYTQRFHFLTGYSQIYAAIYFILLKFKVLTRFEAICKYRESFVSNFITCQTVEGDIMHPLKTMAIHTIFNVAISEN